MDDETPKDDLAVLKNPTKPPGPNTLNQFLVGQLEDTFTMPGICPRRFSRDEALNLAAWLIALADEPVAFEHVNAHGAVLSIEFVELLRAVQNS